MKKEELRQDPVRTFIVKSFTYVSTNANKVFIVLLCFLFIVGIFSYYNHLDNIKIEKSIRLAGRAQNAFINGNIEEAIVKFERIIEDFPGTLGANQALIFLLKSSMISNENSEFDNYLNQEVKNLNDEFIKSSIYRMKSNYEKDNDNYHASLKNLKNINNLFSYSLLSIPSLIDLSDIYILQEDYQKAEEQLELILNIKDISFNDKNQVEEMLFFVKQKMNI
tara:strand:- start:900 stop:1565 length:666 start_codon:yes stop_codon:yes gene_type:complete